MNEISSWRSSLTTYQGSLLHEANCSHASILETISDAYVAVRDPIVEHCNKMPTFMTVDVAFFSVFLSFMFGGEAGLISIGSPYINPNYHLLDDSFVGAMSAFASSAVRNASFAILLTIVNAAIRPYFIEYFPKDWGLSQLALETTLTLTIVAIPLYFSAGQIGLETFQLVQMISVSAFCRLIAGYQYNFEAESMITESKLTSYEMEATPWFTISTPIPIF